MTTPSYISGDFIDAHTDYLELIEELRIGFVQQEIITPPRHHHDFPNSEVGSDTTMLLMPAWQDGTDGGVKIVSVSPENGQLGPPTINGSYIYMDALTGQLKAILEAKKMTSMRTAAASALASLFLSRVDAQSMLMIGTGALSAQLVMAHAAVRPIQQVYVWGRSMEKAQEVCERLSQQNFICQPVADVKSVQGQVDIISTATMSKEPLIKGCDVAPGQHIDLVGSYKPEMREADDDVMSKASIFADVKEMAMIESGDLLIPLRSKVISADDIRADLFDLCRGALGRQDDSEITVFKSVGHALEDLVAARYYYHKFMKSR